MPDDYPGTGWRRDFPDYRDLTANSPKIKAILDESTGYQSVRYYRLDPPGTTPSDILLSVKRFLAAGFPVMFGFSVYTNIPPIGDGRGEIGFPRSGATT